MSLKKRADIQWCPSCGSDKVCYENERIRCYGCGRIFNIEELELLRKHIPK